MVLEATGEFPFQFFIEKASPKEEDGEFILEGIASTTNVDHDNERMSESALRSMAAAINEGGVPLRVEHSKEASAIIGEVYEAKVDDRNQLHVKARLNKDHAVSPILYASMKQGTKMGLSVGGVVRRAMKEFVESTGKMVKTFYDVALQEVSVTPRPANYDSWLVAKSIKEVGEDGDRFRNTGFYNEFLFENPQLDYLQAFAKSVPDDAWHKVVSKTNSENMTTETEEKKSEETTETTKGVVTRQEFNTFANSMVKAIDAIGGTLKKMSESASDQDNPKEDKPKEIGDKSRKSMETDAKDQVNGDKDKPEAIGDKWAKSSADGSDEDGERESKKSETETETKTKSETETEEKKTRKMSESETMTEMEGKKKSEKTDEYDLETVTRSINSIKKIGEGMKKSETETETKTKSESETEEKKTRKAEDEEEETTKGMHPIDQFVVQVTKTLEAMAEKMEKSGKNVLGFEKSIIDAIREDAGIQEEISKMVAIPGRKASVARGIPYVATKEGKVYALTMQDAGAPTITKSIDKAGGDFKSAWKSEFSSVHEMEQ